MDEFENNLKKIRSLEEINEEKKIIEKNIATVKLCLKNKKIVSKVLITIDVFLLVFGVLLGISLNNGHILFDILSGVVISEAFGNLVLYAIRFGDIPTYCDTVINEITEGEDVQEFITNKTNELEQISTKYPNMQEELDELKSRNTLLTKESIEEKLSRDVYIDVNNEEITRRRLK